MALQALAKSGNWIAWLSNSAGFCFDRPCLKHAQVSPEPGCFNPIAPAVTAKPWHAPLAKWEARTRSITAAGASPAVGTAVYRRRAAACLGYAAQLVPPPANLVRKELRAVNKILHMPCGAFSAAMAARLNQVGLSCVRSVFALCTASLAGQLRLASSLGRSGWLGPLAKQSRGDPANGKLVSR